jgi:hypothetical protein
MRAATFYWRMLMNFHRIIRLAWRVVLWNGGSTESIDDRLRRTPGGVREFNELAWHVWPEGFGIKAIEDDNGD